MSRKFKISQDQLSLPFGEVASLGYEGRERAFWAMSLICLLSLGIYFYAINAIARNTALRSGLEAELADTSGRIATMEFAYIGMENAVTSELAAQYGFREVDTPLYVTREAPPSLTLNRGIR